MIDYRAVLDEALREAVKKQFDGLVLQVDSDDGVLDRDFAHFERGLTLLKLAHERAQTIAAKVFGS